MDRESLREYGLSIGVEFAELRDWALGKTIQFMHDRQTDVTWVEAYDRMIYFIDAGDAWIADDSGYFFRSRSLNDAEARQLLAWWVNKQSNFRQYADPEHEDWVKQRRKKALPDFP
jgi:hypothetical protein